MSCKLVKGYLSGYVFECTYVAVTAKLTIQD